MCFLVYSHDEGTLEEMGLELSEDLLDSIMDVKEADAWYGRIFQRMDRDPGPVEEAILELVTELITDPKATFRTNPLLWWVGVLVQSSLQTDRDDYISRGRFDLNILTMDMDIEERLRAVLPLLESVRARPFDEDVEDKRELDGRGARQHGGGGHGMAQCGRRPAAGGQR